MGGMVAQVVAAAAPERLLSLALLSTTPRRTLLEKLPPARELLAILRWCLAATPEDKADVDLSLHFSDAYLDRPLHPGTQARGGGAGPSVRDFWRRVYLAEQSAGAAQPAAGLRGQLRALLGFRLKRRQIARVRARLACGVLVMQGDRDRMVHPGSGPALLRYLTDPWFGAKGARALPRERVELLMLPDTGHFAPIQARHAVARALLDLWASADLCHPGGRGGGALAAAAPAPPAPSLAGLLGRLWRSQAAQGAEAERARMRCDLRARGQRWVPGKTRVPLESLIAVDAGASKLPTTFDVPATFNASRERAFDLHDRFVPGRLPGAASGGGAGAGGTRVAWMVPAGA